ncbi:MAG: hypothetical protein EZS28_043346, partial [Streblomastix strix]
DIVAKPCDESVIPEVVLFYNCTYGPLGYPTRTPGAIIGPQPNHGVERKNVLFFWVDYQKTIYSGVALYSVTVTTYEFSDGSSDSILLKQEIVDH